MKIMIRSGRLVAVFLFLLAVFAGQSLFAAEYKVGPYKVEVDVRTSIMKIIPHALVKCSLSGRVIKVQVSAPGYVAQQAEVSVKSGNFHYATMVVLPDRPKRFDALDFDYKPIVSAYFDPFQGNTPVDKYAINMFLPQKSWPHPHPANLKVNQPGYGWPIQESCEISKFEDFYRVQMIIDRRVLDDPNDEILVYVNTSQEISRENTGVWFRTVADLEKTDPQTAYELSTILLSLLPSDLSGSQVPAILARLLEEKDFFEHLHKDR